MKIKHDRLGLYFEDGILKHVRYAMPGENFTEETQCGDDYALTVISIGGDGLIEQAQHHPHGSSCTIPPTYIEKSNVVIDESIRGVVTYAPFTESWKCQSVFTTNHRPVRPIITGADSIPERPPE